MLTASRPTRRPKWPVRFFSGLGVTAVTAAAVAFAGNHYSTQVFDRVETVTLADPSVAAKDGTPTTAKSSKATGPTVAENYLLVGSDSREGADPNDADYGGIGAAAKTQGKRSDVMLVMRYDPATKNSALVSVPRDLWVTLADTGRKDRVNEAFDRDDPTDRSNNLTTTIAQALNIPINHYVEVNFAGFKALVEAVGGVSVFLEYPVRDSSTGLEIMKAGCVQLTGVQARQYVRSRHLQELKNGKWITDETSDFGRMARQRDFITRAMNKAAAKSAADPLVSGQLLRAVTPFLRLDDKIDLNGLSEQFRNSAASEVLSFALPVAGAKISGNDVLVLKADEAKPILDVFRGTARMESTTTATPEAQSATGGVPGPLPPLSTTAAASPADPAASCR